MGICSRCISCEEYGGATAANTIETMCSSLSSHLAPHTSHPAEQSSVIPHALAKSFSASISASDGFELPVEIVPVN